MSTSNILLKAHNISKEFTDSGLKYKLLDDISFELQGKTFTGILAPRKSGKTLLLRLLAALETPSSGIIESAKPVVYIPSEPSSFPWLSVKGNIELAVKEVSSTQANDIRQIIEITGLSGYEDHFPHNKSLGFRFRISLARALAAKPAIILIDEPFNQMERLTRMEIYELLRKIFLETGTSFLIAASNISEAVFLSDRILILKPGSSGILSEIQTNLPDRRDRDLITKSQFREKAKEIEEFVKIGNSCELDSFLI